MNLWAKTNNSRDALAAMLIPELRVDFLPESGFTTATWGVVPDRLRGIRVVQKDSGNTILPDAVQCSIKGPFEA